MGGCPDNFLVCDNTDYQISKYPDLANYFLANFGSKNYFGGNGTTTFRCPDLRGEFLRGTGTNGHTNQGSGSNTGVHQDATVHTNVKGWCDSSGTANLCNLEMTGSKGQGVYVSNTDSTTQSGNYHWWINTNGSGTSSNEISKYTSRPTNTSVLYCISAVKLI